MQLPLTVSVTPREYASQGKGFPFPGLDHCYNPGCLMGIAPKKHGFYKRNCIDGVRTLRIPIRRYICPYCGTTFSLLPSFCLPYFQYASYLLFCALLMRIAKGITIAQIIALVISEYPNVLWQKAHVSFYCRRFIQNLPRVELLLRERIPGCFLPSLALGKEKRAKKVLNSILQALGLEDFSHWFFQKCRRSFLAPT